MIESIALTQHELAQPGVVDEFNSQVDGEYGADVRMDHETRQRSQHEVDVIWPSVSSCLRVSDGYDAIDVRVISRHLREAIRQGPRVTGRSRCCAEDRDVIARSDAATARPCMAFEASRAGVKVDLAPGPKLRLIQPKWNVVIAKIGLSRE